MNIQPNSTSPRNQINRETENAWHLSTHNLTEADLLSTEYIIEAIRNDSNNQVRTLQIVDMPTDILDQIFLYFNKRELSPVNSTCQIWNGIVKQTRTNEGLDFAQELHLPVESVVETIKMLGAGYSNAYTHMSLYGFNELSDDQFKDSINSLYSGGFTKLSTVYVSKKQLEIFAKIQRELNLKKPIQTIEFIQDPRELHKADIYKQLCNMFQKYSIFWTQLNPGAKIPLSPELETIIDMCSPLKVSTDIERKYFENNSLFNAIDYMDIIQVKGFIMLGGNIETLLYNAVYKGCIDIVKIVIANGANIHARNQYEESLLSGASACGFASIVKVLIENGIDINAKSIYGETALSITINKGYTDIIKILVANGANVNDRTCYGETPLSRAVDQGHADMVKVFIANRAEVNAINENNETALFDAVEKGRIDIVNILIDNGATVNSRDKKGKTCLHIATAYRYIDIVKTLIANGADINYKNLLGETSLNIAMKNRHVEMIELLKANGAI